MAGISHTLPSPATLAWYSIGEAAHLLGISISTIRMYEREGLIITARRDSRHRRYAPGDIARIRCIRETIQKEKLGIAAIRRLLALIPCWKIAGCPDHERAFCGAFRQSAVPCWLASGRSRMCRSAECRSCRVYTDFTDCDSLKQAIASTPSFAGGY
ncbi:MAG: MerR family transcriptional regulator [Bacteroidota bacterium]